MIDYIEILNITLNIGSKIRTGNKIYQNLTEGGIKQYPRRINL